MLKLDRDWVFMTIAADLAQLGTCNRNQVGALIVRDGRCVSWGYNGAPPGMPHCDENKHGWKGVQGARLALLDARFKDSDDPIADAIQTFGCVNATHAEANALAFAARQGISTDAATLFVTLSPCVTCSGLLIAAGIKRVIAREIYRDTAGWEVIQNAGIEFAIVP